jgi:hypothetical protein
MSIYSDEVLWQLFLVGPVEDGDLVSKTGRDELVADDLVVRAKGWQTLTKAGLKLALHRKLDKIKNVSPTLEKYDAL